ncbi:MULTISPECIES: ADP-ribosylglycohydrolase family protein [unclassified Polaromonas]|uniref:ADP-ribosylglycohydrolase family protein n=1 Tax=Polaromonas sp. CG_9.2 TaxID=2787731 RepID=UPI0021046D0C|nr:MULTISPECIES: ADP-ribosylglycohydrolase family protein [unclassified Polaromonas]
MADDDPQPYNSWDNGASMRVNAAVLLATSLDHALELSKRVTVITHNHHEGIKGAAETSVAIWLARQRTSAADIRQELMACFGYDLDRTVDGIRPGYRFTEASADSVPQALVCALEAMSYEDALRNVVSIGSRGALWHSARDRGQGLVRPAARHAPGIDGALCAGKFSRCLSPITSTTCGEFSWAILFDGATRGCRRPHANPAPMDKQCLCRPDQRRWPVARPNP